MKPRHLILHAFILGILLLGGFWLLPPKNQTVDEVAFGVAGNKLQELTAFTVPTSDDLIYMVDDPSGTPGDKKITYSDFSSNLILSESDTLASVVRRGAFATGTVTLSGGATVGGTLNATGTVTLPSATTINSQNVCLADGSNCAATGGAQTLAQVSSLGSSATATLALYGGATVGGTLTATGTVALPSGTTVNSQNVCLADGTNCIASGGSQTLAQVTALGKSSTNTLDLYGGANFGGNVASTGTETFASTTITRLIYENGTSTGSAFFTKSTSTAFFATSLGATIGRFATSLFTSAFTATGAVNLGLLVDAFTMIGDLTISSATPSIIFEDTTAGQDQMEIDVNADVGNFKMAGLSTMRLKTVESGGSQAVDAGTRVVMHSVSTTNFTVGGQDVCLADGTNCAASGGSQTWGQTTSLGGQSTSTLNSYGSLTVGGTLMATGTTDLQGTTLTNATFTASGLFVSGGSATTPTVRIGAQGTGLFASSTGNLSATVAGTEQVRFSNSAVEIVDSGGPRLTFIDLDASARNFEFDVDSNDLQIYDITKAGVVRNWLDFLENGSGQEAFIYSTTTLSTTNPSFTLGDTTSGHDDFTFAANFDLLTISPSISSTPTLAMLELTSRPAPALFGNVGIVWSHASGNDLYVSSTARVGLLKVLETGTSTFAGPVSSTRLTVSGIEENTAVMANVCVNGGGKFYKDSTLACTASNPDQKDNIVPLSGNALSTVLALEPIEFDWKPTTGRTGHDFGFNAEQAADVDERLIVREEGGRVKGFRYMEFTAYLTKAIQEFYEEQKEKDSSQDMKIEQLKRENADLKMRLDRVEKLISH